MSGVVTIVCDVDSKVADDLREIIDGLTGAKRTEFNEVGAVAAVEAAAEWHRGFDEAGGWRGPRSFGSGRSKFGAAIAAGWRVHTVDVDTAMIANNAEHYAFKVSGGKITPKRVSYLTIPLTKEAHGRTARDYEIWAKRKLFTIPGRNALFEKVDGDGTETAVKTIYGSYKKGKRSTSVRGRRATVKAKQQIRPVYALLKSVTMPPMPQAVPPEDLVIEHFMDAWSQSLEDWIEEELG